MQPSDAQRTITCQNAHCCARANSDTMRQANTIYFWRSVVEVIVAAAFSNTGIRNRPTQKITIIKG
jgi:hypothetical protein